MLPGPADTSGMRSTTRPPAGGWRRFLVPACLLALTVAFILGARTARHGGTTGDFPIYYRAAAASASGLPLADAAANGYLCPPLCAAIMSPLGHASQGTAAILWVACSMALFALILWVGARDALSRWGFSATGARTMLVVLGATILSFGQLRDEFAGGQVDGLMLAGFAFGLAFIDTHPLLAGMAIGFGINIKYTTLIILPYLVLRRRWLAAASASAWSVGFALLPALVTGWRVNADNLSIAMGGLRDLIGGGAKASVAAMPSLDYSRSVSLTSAASRLIPASWGHAAVFGAVGVAALALFLACAAIYRRNTTPLWTRPPPEAPDARALTSLEWCALMAVVMLFSPQTQVRHMVALVLPHLIAVALLLRRPRYASILITGMVVLQAGLLLPPGPSLGQRTLDLSRTIGWPSWCLAVFLLTLLWTGLDECRRMRSATAVR